MKQQQSEQNFENEIKFLHKKFHILDKPNTKLLYEFCEFDPQRAYKVLSIAKTLRNPTCIIQNLIKNPQKSQDYLDQLVKRYDNQIGEIVQLSIQKVEDKKKSKEIIKLDFEFFEDVPVDMIGTIMTYLDPYSLKMLTFTSSVMNKIGKAQAISELYKQICKVLFGNTIPKLPEKCRFQTVKKFVLTHPQQYFPYHNNFKNAVNNNLRQYIWKLQPLEMKVQNNYYKQFGSYQSLFSKCPRVNLNGYYICKHKYVKIGQKDATHFITPIHIIYYYRYLRFVQDGSIIYHVSCCYYRQKKVSNKKMKQEEVLRYLSRRVVEQEMEGQGQTIVGEFMQCRDRVHVRAVKDNSVFSYELQINSTDSKISNQLRVINYKLQLIDKSYMTQTLFVANPHKEDLIFQYVYNSEIKSENGQRIQACSL